jgi:hypothetical protein
MRQIPLILLLLAIQVKIVKAGIPLEWSGADKNTESE